MHARRDVPRCGRRTARLAVAAIVSLCASLATAAAERPGKEAVRAEEPPKASLLDFLLGAGETRRVRDEARKLKDALPDYPHPVKVPDGATILGWIRELCETPHRRPGTPEGQRAEAWIADRFRSLGLDGVSEDRIPITVWSPAEGSLSVEGRSVPCHFILNAGFTPSGGVTAPMVWVGQGGLSRFAGKKAAGKIVVAEARTAPRRPEEDAWAVWFTSDPGKHVGPGNRHLAIPWNLLGDFLNAAVLDVYSQAQLAGAAGIIVVVRGSQTSPPTLYWPYDGAMKKLPGLYVGEGEGALLEEQAQMGKTATLRLVGTTRLGATSNIWGTLPGASPETILIASHHDSPYRGAVEDGTGMAQLLAQAWAWSRVPREKRPRTLVFLASAAHMYKGVGALTFARSHPEVLRRARVTITLEHLAAREVREGPRGGYELTGSPQVSVLYAARDPRVVGPLWRALERKPPLATVCRAAGVELPLSDAAGLVGWSKDRASGYERKGGLPFVSWTSAPLYLLDAADTLDKVDRDQLVPIAGTVTEIVKAFQVAP